VRTALVVTVAHTLSKRLFRPPLTVVPLVETPQYFTTRKADATTISKADDNGTKA
jgi:hypothetical protein